jgi:hypothetical protein
MPKVKRWIMSDQTSAHPSARHKIARDTKLRATQNCARHKIARDTKLRATQNCARLRNVFLAGTMLCDVFDTLHLPLCSLCACDYAVCTCAAQSSCELFGQFIIFVPIQERERESLCVS